MFNRFKKKMLPVPFLRKGKILTNIFIQIPDTNYISDMSIIASNTEQRQSIDGLFSEGKTQKYAPHSAQNCHHP